MAIHGLTCDNELVTDHNPDLAAKIRQMAMARVPESAEPTPPMGVPAEPLILHPTEGERMADEMTYHNGYHHVRDNDDHDEVLLGQHLGTVGSAGRDVADAGRDLTSASADANRDLINANSDANRDLISALHGGGQHGQILSAILDSRGHTTDQINAVGRDVLREAASVREEVSQQGKENIVGTLDQGSRGREVTFDQGSRGREVTFDQGSRGRETTLATSAQIREDLADAKADLMKEHCETQKLVITEHCKTREQLAAESVKTRELISAEARATVEREMRSLSEQNSLLQIQLNLLSGGGIGGLKA